MYPDIKSKIEAASKNQLLNDLDFFSWSFMLFLFDHFRQLFSPHVYFTPVLHLSINLYDF